jgi:hypothetical protein
MKATLECVVTCTSGHACLRVIPAVGQMLQIASDVGRTRTGSRAHAYVSMTGLVALIAEYTLDFVQAYVMDA